MKYYIQRGLNEYGPYTLADLQRYIASGNIQLTDLTRNEAMKEWVPVSQVIGNIPLPPPTAQAPVPYSTTPAAAAATPYGATPAAGASQPASASPAAAANAQPAAGFGADGRDVFGGGPAAASSSTGTVYGDPGTMPGGPAYGGAGTAPGGPYGGTGMAPAYAAAPAQGMIPPDFHWALVLLIGVLTCGLFSSVWLIVEAVFVRKLKPNTNTLVLIILGVAIPFVGGFVGGFIAALNHTETPIGGLAAIAGLVLQLIGVFQIRADLEDYYNRVEPINLKLSGVMTFFFSTLYFQHHFSRIAAWKKTGYLTPQ